MSLKHISFQIRPVPPFRLDLTVWALRRRPDNIIDRWDGRVYRRVLVAADEPVEVATTNTGTPKEPRLQIIGTAQQFSPEAKSEISEEIEKLLGINVDMSDFYQFADRNKELRPLAEHFRGVKPPRFCSVFEALVNGIVCQQITLTLGIQMLNRLAQKYGPSFNLETETHYGFPEPEDLAGLEPEVIRKLGLSNNKARALIELSRSLVFECLDLEHLTNIKDEEVMRFLDNLEGVGRWTAEYVLLRGLGRMHIFPASDVGGRNNLRRWLGIKKALDYEETKKALEPWQPFSGLVYFHLLLNRLEEAGYLR